MYKSNTELIVIDAKATEPISTNVVFWSHDKGTAKMLFQLQKDYVNQTLSEGTIVPICLDFVGGRHIYHAVIEDAVNGIVSIVLEDNILGYVGRVDGSIYIELPDSRSLDTAGRFTFQIKRSPIDEDVPELEDYYWQGFNEIMNQYHGTIATIKFEAKTTLDSLTADVTTVQNELTNLNTRIDEINKKIDDNDVFTKAESSANVVDQVIGKEKGQISVITDFKNKVTNSSVENPHWAGAAFVGDKLEKPSYFVIEVSQTRYNSLSEKDGDTAFITATGADLRPSLCLKYDLLEIVKRRLGEDFFIDREATTTEQQLSLLDAIVTNFEIGTYAKGTGVEAGKATNWCASKLWFDNSQWTTGTPQNTTGEIKRLAFALDPVNKLSRYLDEKGILQVIVYGGLSDGVTNTNVRVDYSDLLIDIEVSSNKHIKSIVAANHVKNLATQSEAENATDNNKTMTPLRTKQLLDSKLLNMVYPIGSIYMSVNSATPATLFGGTWERFSKGRVLVGVDESDTVLATSEKQGGSTNPLTAHTHTTQLTTYRVTSTGSGAVNNLARSTDQGNAMTGEFGSVTSNGDNTDHKNWQPFTTVYIWKRIA